MDISYLGHSAFKIKTKSGTIVMDPYGSMTGLKMPSVSADVVTLSHDHEDHNAASSVTGTARRKEPFVISEPGEYEVEGISIFAYSTYHDDKSGAERGENIIYVVQAEDMRILHLGDLGHLLSDKQAQEVGAVDLVMVPVGGHFTINAEQASKVVESVDPSYVIPMHFRTDAHDQKTFGELATVDEFVKSYGHPTKTVKSLAVSRLSLPQDATEVVLFE